jgi:hypothetical protein
MFTCVAAATAVRYSPYPQRRSQVNLSRSFAAPLPPPPKQTTIPPLKLVWLSSHRYTLPKFKAKADASWKALLACLSVPATKQLSPLDVEALFWRSSADRPVIVEYASDMPGSRFAPCAARPTQLPAANVGETAWNMRGVARSPASLPRFVREEVRVCPRQCISRGRGILRAPETAQSPSRKKFSRFAVEAARGYIRVPHLWIAT